MRQVGNPQKRSPAVLKQSRVMVKFVIKLKNNCLLFNILEDETPITTWCSCGTRCATKACPCKRNCIACSSTCHPSKTCCNTSMIVATTGTIDVLDDNSSTCTKVDCWMTIGSTQLYSSDRSCIIKCMAK